MRTWPALDVGRLKAAPTTESPAAPTTESPAAPTTELPAAPTTADLLQAALTDFDVSAIDERSADSWRVFFATPAARDGAASALRPAFPGLTLDPIDVDDEDWAARSQADLRAVRVGRVIVAPPWDVPLVVTVQPSTGFGTGHHPTTRLCLAALQRIDLADRRVLDVGTGSGVLAIVASLLGAPDVTGIDDDEDAIRAAWENLALNPAAVVSLLAGDFRRTELTAADVVVANLTGALLIASAERIRRLAAPRGRLILSGFTSDEDRDVAAAFAGASANARDAVEHRDEEEGWVCLTLLA